MLRYFEKIMIIKMYSYAHIGVLSCYRPERINRCIECPDKYRQKYITFLFCHNYVNNNYYKGGKPSLLSTIHYHDYKYILISVQINAV